LVTQPGPAAAPSSGRAAFAISQSYYYLAAVVGVGLLLGGVIGALIGVRQWILPAGPDPTGSPFLEGSSRDAIRGILGGLAFAIPGGVVSWWHLREARRRDAVRIADVSWGSALYFHLVAFVALTIAVGGAIGTLHSLADAAFPDCFEEPTQVLRPSDVMPIPGTAAGEASLAPQPVPIGTFRECYPPSSVSLRSALDGLIVAAVAGATWAWHLRRGRRLGAARPEG
jgi:Domain of unknown function (DUF5671)